MSSFVVANVLAGMPVADMDTAIDWYTRLLGRSPDARPMPGLADWHFPHQQTLQLVLDTGRAGGGIVTLHVADIAAARDALAREGIHVDLDDTTSDKVEFGQLTDPDGNSVSLVEPFPDFQPTASH
jgi:catechol 2,3-dioxygenase-like lactoylglutathione lyase family enzyme